ncbi:organic hydroperoxide resistance protein [Euzebyella marina]|uniref:Organic hydroperoxide resistance protein n=1 Tax=Euzebyella marina TaxID=1761453 RepID=A0A3G2L8S4_9FLAO|nr:organic hydroperoxide resistance protein [Euzebyella marina]AYN68688.1 organic hydroperoxide resistance protein [Euzebyella marina]MAU72232.1 Ohr subfamily peroxiredoxin [Pseudozobellia sp.]MBG49817.1 Ohr subfamily peroxiredoxin [Pseudozobellia sp.]|tara:strand:+ start:39 stop:464 length:426 start_codon:yes stop_codon:yes gene_type:complete
MKTIFQASATNSGGRDGHVKSDDGAIDLDIKMPNSKGETDGKSTNPEQLFAAAYSTCFAGALQAVAKEHGVDDLGDFSVTAVVGFNKDDEGFFIDATLDCWLPTVDKKKGEDLINAAHEICPYSKATRDNITVELNLMVEA